MSSTRLAVLINGEVSADVLDDYSEQRLRVFNDQASPAASHFKQLVYHTTDQVELEQQLEQARVAAGDPELRLQALIGMRSLITPSLVTGN